MPSRDAVNEPPPVQPWRSRRVSGESVEPPPVVVEPTCVRKKSVRRARVSPHCVTVSRCQLCAARRDAFEIRYTVHGCAFTYVRTYCSQRYGTRVSTRQYV